MHAQPSVVLKEKQTELIKCDKCDYNGNNKDELDAHLDSNHKESVHEQPKVIKCDECDY